MIHDKISLAIKDIKKIKEELNEIKKDIKREEKLDTTEYLEIKRAHSDIKQQKKDMEDGHKNELATDENFNKLRELKVKAEETLAHANERLFGLIAELPQQPFNMNVDLEEGPVRVQVMPEMRLYLNGKEEKKRSA